MAGPARIPESRARDVRRNGPPDTGAASRRSRAHRRTWLNSSTGETLESAKLFRFDADKLVEIMSFPNTYSDNCSGGIEPKIKNFVVIRAVTRRGAAPVFRIEKQSALCSSPTGP